MRKPFNVEFTQAAKVEAVKQGIALSSLESYIRHDLRENGYHEEVDDAECWPPDLFFHTIDYDKQRCWLVVGNGKDGITVDSASYVEGAPLESGPFKGKKLCLPVGDELREGWIDSPEEE